MAETHPAAAQYAILAHNNLGYHLMLLGDPTAIEHAQAGLSMARELGVLTFQPYLLSTLGEIALNRGDLDAAERSFADAVDLHCRVQIAECTFGLMPSEAITAPWILIATVAIRH